MTQSVLVLGANGTFGGAAAKAFADAGWDVLRFNRATDDLPTRAKQVDVIVNGWNPQGYRNWDTEVPRITAEVIDAARASGATIVIPGNVYNFGAAPGPWLETTPQEAHTRKGRIRIDMERTYRAATESGVRTIVLRAGDYMARDSKSSWLNQVIAARVNRGKFTYPGNREIDHAWAYVPDMARAAVALAERRKSLPAFAAVSFPGYTLTGKEVKEHLEAITGRVLRVARFPWWAMELAAPFWTLGREMREMRYLWETSHSLDGAQFRELVPDFRPTSVRAALADCLSIEMQPQSSRADLARPSGGFV